MPRPVSKNLPILLGFLIAVGPVSTDMYLPAFPAIARDLHNPAAPQYSLAAYFIGLAIGQMTQGALSDRIGRRKPLLAGLIIYTLATTGCWLSWNVESFTIFRFLTALGASAGVVIPRAMVRDLADGPAAAKLFSKLTLVMGVAPIAAPMLGSVCVIFASWRVIFAVCALYGVIAAAAIWFLLPDTLPIARRTRIGFIPVLLRYAAIFRERAFLSHACVAAFTSAALFGYLAASPLIFIDAYGWSTTDYAVLFGVNSFVYICFNQLNPALVTRFGVARVITIASVILLTGCLGLVVMAFFPHGPFPIAGLLAFSESGVGLLLPCSLVGALSRHQAHAGSASALLGTMQFTGAAITGLLMGVLADGTARPMAAAMLLCAAAVMLAAALRPSLSFSPTES